MCQNNERTMGGGWTRKRVPDTLMAKLKKAAWAIKAIRHNGGGW
jgi:hypothetical protein